MMPTTNHDLEELARLLALLPPAPQGWCQAAQELPRLRAVLDGLIERAEADADARGRILGDLEAALLESGVTPTPRVIDEARRRLQR